MRRLGFRHHRGHSYGLECTADGSLYLGLMIATCLASAASLCAQPSNDACGSAIAVGNGTFTANNQTATTDGSASCGFIGNTGGGDLWWRYTPPFTGLAVAHTCESNFDTMLSVYDTCGGTELACNDDQFGGFCGTGPTMVVRSRVEWQVTGGVSYLVRVAGYGIRRGNITLHISESTDEPVCGDGTCNGDDDPCSCPQDGCTASCGDSCCSHGEDQESCPSDCASLDDFAAFQNCFSGPLPADESCDDHDFDEDSDVDGDDYAEFASRMWMTP